MTAQLNYVKSLVENYTPDDLAELIVEPYGGRARAIKVETIQQWVEDYGDDDLKTEWREKLAKVPTVTRKEDWPVGFALPVALLLGFKLPEPAEKPEKPPKTKPAEVTEIGRAAA